MSANPYDYASPEAVGRRFWRHMVFALAAGSVAAVALANPRFVLGFAAGGVLALLNFRWLLGSVRAVFAVGSRRVPPGTTMKFALRWIVIAGIGYGLCLTRRVDPAGILVALLVPGAAALMEAAYLIYRGADGPAGVIKKQID
ncbi:MAG TPA: ATP synthase subunit I [Blastocatellia bacterium]|nr:ATP synthase subunit I [Blastocatellia bacterium]